MPDLAHFVACASEGGCYTIPQEILRDLVLLSGQSTVSCSQHMLPSRLQLKSRAFCSCFHGTASTLKVIPGSFRDTMITQQPSAVHKQQENGSYTEQMSSGAFLQPCGFAGHTALLQSPMHSSRGPPSQQMHPVPGTTAQFFVLLMPHLAAETHHMYS